MKHIEKRFFNEFKMTDEVAAVVEEAGKENIGKDWRLEDFGDNFVPHIYASDNTFYKAFLLEVEGERLIVPEPDPILIYFDCGYANYKKLEEAKQSLIPKLIASSKGQDAPPINEMFSFFSMVSAFAIYLCTAIEATMNRAIPANYTYTRPGKQRVYTKEEIERFFRAEEKLNDVLKQITNKSFEDTYPDDFKLIKELEGFRNDIVHTKEIAVGTEPVSHNFTRAFRLEYENTIEAVKRFCNFYLGDNFIVDCKCGRDI
ncbi:MAG: hypothetical protein QM737_22700 [Ferruginibacter sp.]